ncbi:F0F1 ATP synthase subunit B [Pleurocapsales cyanobacterium LEGE 06147]|nr:F0F1 ATP synthase subunit B [Pleurocapsales cyanobacterium LEGE 06147]
MLIDWFTVIAQIINFLILVFLLWRFLYKPIVQTMDKRQQQLETRWQNAREEREKARQEAEEYRQKQRQLQEEREEILAQTRERAEQKRHELIRQVRQNVERLEAEWKQAIAREQDSFLDNLQQQMREQTVAIARRVLQDLADVELEQQVVSLFLDRLHQLSESEREQLVQSSSDSQLEVVIRSSFDLSESLRQKIIDTLEKEQITHQDNVQFTTASDLICGIQLLVGNYEIAWNIDEYLQNLERQFAQNFSH